MSMLLTPADPVANLEAVKKNWLWFVVLGVVLIALSIIGFAIGLISLSFAVTVFFGVLLLFGGTMHVVHAFMTRDWSGFLLEIIVGALYLLGGVAILARPLAGMVFLTLLLGFCFFFHGILRIVLAFQIREFNNWFLLLLGGVISVLLGLLIVTQIPIGVIGLLVTLDLLFNGVSFLLLGFLVKSMPTAAGQQPSSPGEGAEQHEQVETKQE